MLTVIDRYLLLELLKVFFAVLASVMLIVFSMLFLRTLEEVNVGALGSDIVLRFLSLQVLRDTSSLLPPIFFIAVLMALGRLARDGELVALSTCGLGPVETYRSLFYVAIPLAMITAWFSLYLRPMVVDEIQDIRIRQKEQAYQILGLRAGRFYQEEQGEVTLYLKSISDTGTLQNIFILDRRGDEPILILSKEGALVLDQETGERWVALRNGRRYDGTPGQAEYGIGEFGSFRQRIQSRGPEDLRSNKRSTFKTRDLLASDDLGDKAELQFRSAGPLAIITLTLLAVPLTTKSPRQPGTWRLFVAFLTYVSFFNVQRVAANWYETAATPAWLGSLWYQPAILLIVLAVLIPDSDWLKRLKQRFRRRRGA